MTTTSGRARRRAARGSARHGLHTLAIDIGGTHLKASVLDGEGREMAHRVQEETPHPAPPERVLDLLDAMTQSLPAFDRVSVGFPGVVKKGRIVTAPNLGSEDWHDFPLAGALGKRWGKPVRVLNDAEVQGFGDIQGKGLECVVTLGTGFGTALYRDGELMPHLELGQHPVWNGKTYDRYLGAAALHEKGVRKWNKRVRRAIDTLRTLLNYDRLYIGGGNAHKIAFELPPDVRLASNEAGITGGIRLWDSAMDRFFS